MKPYNVYKGKKIKKTMIGGELADCFYIQKKKTEIVNDIYLVLRPDKDSVANQLFPDKRVVYLRYDSPDDLILINQYKELS